jgi:hypothetical protein
MRAEEELEKLVEADIDVKRIAREIALELKRCCGNHPDVTESTHDRFEHVRVMQRIGLVSKCAECCINGVYNYRLSTSARNLYNKLKEESCFLQENREDKSDE